MRISAQLFCNPNTSSCNPLQLSYPKFVSYPMVQVSSPAPQFGHPLSCFFRVYCIPVTAPAMTQQSSLFPVCLLAFPGPAPWSSQLDNKGISSLVNFIIFDLRLVKGFFLLMYLMGNSRKSSVKPGESLSGRLAWLETQIQWTARNVLENIATFEHAPQSFQNAIFSQILIHDM